MVAIPELCKISVLQTTSKECTDWYFPYCSSRKAVESCWFLSEVQTDQSFEGVESVTRQSHSDIYSQSSCIHLVIS